MKTSNVLAISVGLCSLLSSCGGTDDVIKSCKQTLFLTSMSQTDDSLFTARYAAKVKEGDGIACRSFLLSSGGGSLSYINVTSATKSGYLSGLNFGEDRVLKFKNNDKRVPLMSVRIDGFKDLTTGEWRKWMFPFSGNLKTEGVVVGSVNREDVAETLEVEFVVE